MKKRENQNWGQQGIRSKQKKRKQKKTKIREAHTRAQKTRSKKQKHNIYIFFLRFFHYSIYKKPEL
jgi:hypothetical protein